MMIYLIDDLITKTSCYKKYIHVNLKSLTILLSIAICFASCKKDTSSQSQVVQPLKSTPTVVILGSSTALGVGASTVDSSWAKIVQTTVNAHGVKANFINLAFGGYTTYDVMPTGFYVANRPTPDTTRNITKALSYKPSLVIISLPNNDIADTFTYQEILSNYTRLTSMLDSAKVPYLIFSTQPRDFADVNERMRLNVLNNDIINTYSGKVNNFLDQLSTSTFSIDSIYSAGDGIHLNNAGHRIIANATLKQPILLNIVK